MKVLPVVLATLATCSAFGVPKDSTSTNLHLVSRSNFVQILGGATAAACLIGEAEAKDIDPAIKGTKKDPTFEACLSQCMYDCTKPKGAEQKSRAECLPECKQKCATSKAQLLKGDPKTD